MLVPLHETYRRGADSADTFHVEPAGQIPASPSTDAVDGNVVVPHVVGLPLDVAGRVLRSLHLEASTVGADRVDEFGYAVPVAAPIEPPAELKGNRQRVLLVTGQHPNADTSVVSGSVVHLEFVSTVVRVGVNRFAIVAVSFLLAAVAVLGGSWVTQTWQQRPVTVENYMGLPSAVAEAAAPSDHVTIGYPMVEVLSSEPVGTVIGQRPVPGTEVVPGTTVVLTVAGGDIPTVVPNVAGLKEAVAAQKLAAVHLQLGVVREIDSDKPKGTVVRQSLRQGMTTFQGNRVTVYVSRGLVLVPDVSGMTGSQARTELQAAGFMVQIFRVQGVPGMVAGQFPVPGSTYSTDSPVAVMVGFAVPIPSRSPTPGPSPTPTVTVTVTPSPSTSPSRSTNPTP